MSVDFLVVHGGVSGSVRGYTRCGSSRFVEFTGNEERMKAFHAQILEKMQDVRQLTMTRTRLNEMKVLLGYSWIMPEKGWGGLYLKWLDVQTTPDASW